MKIEWKDLDSFIKFPDNVGQIFYDTIDSELLLYDDLISNINYKFNDDNLFAQSELLGLFHTIKEDHTVPCTDIISFYKVDFINNQSIYIGIDSNNNLLNRIDYE